LRRCQPKGKTRLAPEGEAAGCSLALEQPAGGPVRAAKELAHGGMPRSAAAGGGGVWERNGLENRQKRVRAVEAKVAPERQLLSEAPRAALEKATGEKEAQGEVASAGPGDWGAQETFSVGTLKGGGRSSQPTFLAPSSQGGLAKRSERKLSLTAAALLKDQGVPFFATPAVPLSRRLPARGTE
jgi:hypothetical protein